MKKIFNKIFGGYLLLILLFSTIVYFIILNILSNSYEETVTKDLENINNTLIVNVSHLIINKEHAIIDSLIKTLGKKINVRITVIEPNGKVIADSEGNPANMENHLNRPEFQKAMNGYGKSIRFSSTVRKDMMYIAMPIKNQDGNIMALARTSIYLKSLDSIINCESLNLWIIFTGLILFSILIALIVSHSITKPIKKLTELTNEIAKGNIDAIQEDLKSNDEINLLSNAIKEMINKMRDLIDEEETKRVEILNIITSMKQGLAVINISGKIILANTSLKKITGFDNLEGKQLGEVLRNDEVIKVIKKIQEKKNGKQFEILVNNTYYLFSANVINNKNDIVFILYDISELKRVEQIKKDFVTNVSHELKTPLTVIKGYVETLEDNVTDDYKKYIDIIKKHTNRLIKIVNELLLISEMEEKNLKREFSTFNLGELAKDVFLSYEQKMKDKKLKTELKIQDDLPQVHGDAFKLEQMLINLIDNAVKYTESGSISLELKTVGDFISIEVTDTGLGIDDKDKERIFERFYTVDKSRSKQLDGTGLGLSIVKHIVLLHNGTIELISNLGLGSKFIVKIPYTK